MSANFSFFLEKNDKNMELKQQGVTPQEKSNPSDPNELDINGRNKDGEADAKPNEFFYLKLLPPKCEPESQIHIPKIPKLDKEVQNEDKLQSPRKKPLVIKLPPKTEKPKQNPGISNAISQLKMKPFKNRELTSLSDTPEWKSSSTFYRDRQPQKGCVRFGDVLSRHDGESLRMGGCTTGRMTDDWLSHDTSPVQREIDLYPSHQPGASQASGDQRIKSDSTSTTNSQGKIYDCIFIS